MADKKLDRELTIDEKRTLLKIARNSIRKAILGEKPAPLEMDSDIFHQKRGAFVTLHNHGQLRGCVGFIMEVKPLIETIEEMAQAAALRDSRFEPVKAEEIDDLDIEISVISPLQEIDDINEIKVGTHGLMIRHGLFSGLLLPQVATQHGWDRQTFLEYTCLKAGLPTNAWKNPDAKIYIFSAQVFSEKDVMGKE